MKLYELTDSYKSVLELFSDQEQSFDDALITDTLESIELDVDEKIINTAAVIKTLQAEAEAIKNAMAPMLERQKALESRADGLRSYLLLNMKKVGKTNVKSPWLTVAVHKSPVSVKINEEWLVPSEFLTEVVTVKINKTNIKNAWGDAGIPGCELIQSEHLRIK